MEITANKTKRARFASVGKSVALDADMDSVLPPVDRSETSIEKAFADLSLPKDKLKHALFWFVKDTNFDEMALGHLNAGDMGKAKEILGKKETWSSLINLGVLAMVQGDYDTAVNHIIHVIREYDGKGYYEKYISSICGDTFQIEDDDVMRLFIDALFEELDPMQVYQLFLDSDCIVDDDEYVKEKIIGAPISRIKAEISKAKAVDPEDGEASYLAGRALMNCTKADLELIKSMCMPSDSAYRMIADSLAKQIMQCGINYYNNCDEDPYYSVDKAMVLQDYSCRIAVGPLTKEHCQKNAAALKKIKDNMPPKEIKEDYDCIINLLNSFENNVQSGAPKIDIFARSKASNQSLSLISKAIELIKNCAPHLRSIKEYAGKQDEKYLMVSTAVAKSALGATIEAVNSAQREKDIFGNVNISLVKDAIKEGWRATLYMDKLDLEASFRQGSYKENRDTLKSMIDGLHGFGLLSAYPRKLMLDSVFGERIVVDLDMRTEQEVFDSCKTEDDFQRFLKNFPFGQFKEEAKQRLAVFETRKWEKCNSLEDYRDYLKQYPRGRHCGEAAAKIKQLEEDLLWETSKSKDTIEAYNKYLADTKMSKYAQEASLAIVRIKDEQRRDEAMWATCTKKEDYEKYLQTFPRALHKREADERLAKIASQRQTLIVAAVFLVLGLVVTLSILFGG